MKAEPVVTKGNFPRAGKPQPAGFRHTRQNGRCNRGFLQRAASDRYHYGSAAVRRLVSSHSRPCHRWVGGRRIGNAASHPGGCMLQYHSRRGRAAALKEMGCDPLKVTVLRLLCDEHRRRMGFFSGRSKHFLQSFTGRKISAHSMDTPSRRSGRRANVEPFH
jgi:hypothetical protein